jgi:hypothetical protein
MINPQETISWIEHPEIYAKLTGTPLEKIKKHIPTPNDKPTKPPRYNQSQA